MNFDHFYWTHTYRVGLGIEPTAEGDKCRTEDFQTPAHHSVFYCTLGK